MKCYDHIIIGAGIYGATVARRLTDAGKSVLVIDKRDHVGGNCYTEDYQDTGITVHVHGPHIFHTSDDIVWTFVNKFSSFNRFVNRVKAKVNNKVFSLPFNMMTYQQIWGVTNQHDARVCVANDLVQNDEDSFEGLALRTIGKTLYETFLRDYTTKQWGKHPREISSSVFKRMQLRYTWDDDYYSDKYEGIPTVGYTKLIQNMLWNIDVELNVDFVIERENIKKLAKRSILYTGQLDHLYNEEKLRYRSLNFNHLLLDQDDYQGSAIINYPSVSIPYTRIIEHKHFMCDVMPKSPTIVSTEVPVECSEGREAYYPIVDKNSERLHALYLDHFAQEFGKSSFVGGRLGTYTYMDMDDAIGAAFNTAKRML